MATKKKGKKYTPKNYYETVSNNYTKFVEITPDVYKRLTKKQKKYIRAQAEHYKEDIRLIKTEHLQSLPHDFRIKQEERIRDILEGRVYNQNMQKTIENYRKGIEFNGNENLADKFQYLTDHMNESELDTLFNEIPNLWLYYKDTTGHSKRNENLSQETIDDALEQLEQIVDEKLQEKELDDEFGDFL